MRLAVYLVGSIDEDGYLRRDLESVADDIAFTLGEEVSPERLEAILKVIHDLEPAGIGARNLRECLLLQLSQLPMTTAFAAAGAQDPDLLFRRIRKKTLREADLAVAGH